MRLTVLTILMFICSISLKANVGDKYIDSLVSIYSNSSQHDQYQISKNIASYISKKDTLEVKQIYRKLIGESREIDKILYTQAVYYYSREMMFYKYNKDFWEYWDLGIKLAEQNNLTFEIGDFYALKAEYFNRIKQYDSLFVYTLKAEKYFLILDDRDKLVTCYILLADSYYNIELFESAEKYYQKIFNLKGDIEYWNKYRKYLILNNIGLVKQHQDSLQLALKYFQSAYYIQLDLLKSETNSSFLIRKAYSQLCLADVNLKLGNIGESQKLFLESCKYLELRNRRNQFVNLYSVGGELYLKLHKIDSAFLFLNRAKEIQEANNEIPDLIVTNKLLSECYLITNDLANYRQSIEKAYQLDKQRRKELDNSKIIQIKAENDLQIFNEEIATANKVLMIVTIAAIGLTCLLITILYLYISVKKAHKHLVRKTVEMLKVEKEHQILLIADNDLPEKSIAELVEIPEIGTSHTINNIPIETEIKPNGIIETEDIIEDSVLEKDGYLEELARKIDRIIVNEKLYLNPEFSISDLSSKLKVNRTYISKAVNGYLKEENFKAYINSLRTKKVLLLLADDQNDKYTLEALYEIAGFNSRNSFNRSFLKLTGVTPSYYQKNRHLFEQIS